MRVIEIKTFLELAKNNNPVVDVRSPSEYAGGHIQGAINIPLFSDQERARIGTIYKNEGQEIAIGKGIELAKDKIDDFIKAYKELEYQSGILIHCWRGGMRSESVGWLLESVEIPCFILKGGYKSFRQHIHQFFGQFSHLMILSGPTGSGKTDILKELKPLGEQVIDLEAVAHHCGSVFGGINKEKQPTTEQFHNNLFFSIQDFNPNQRTWIEDENQVIGTVVLPESLWQQMLSSSRIRIELSQKLRVIRLVKEYGSAGQSELEAGIRKLEKRLGNKRMKEAIDYLRDGHLGKIVKTLLSYYDKAYHKSFQIKQDLHLDVIRLEEDNPGQTARKILETIKSTLSVS